MEKTEHFTMKVWTTDSEDTVFVEAETNGISFYTSASSRSQATAMMRAALEEFMRNFNESLPAKIPEHTDPEAWLAPGKTVMKGDTEYIVTEPVRRHGPRRVVTIEKKANPTNDAPEVVLVSVVSKP